MAVVLSYHQKLVVFIKLLTTSIIWYLCVSGCLGTKMDLMINVKNVIRLVTFQMELRLSAVNLMNLAPLISLIRKVVL